MHELIFSFNAVWNSHFLWVVWEYPIITIFLETEFQTGYEASYFNYALCGHLPKCTSEPALILLLEALHIYE